MVRNLIIFWFKIVFLSILISFTPHVFAQANAVEPQYINICDTSFVLKKYSVSPPPPGYNIIWILDNQINIQGDLNSNIIYIKWENEGVYNIIVQYSNGDCFSQNELEIIIEGCPDVTLYIPNAFTPNEDPINNKFGAYGEGIIQFNMQIYNRWGELLFVSSSIENKWEGTYKNKICPDGVYVYKIKYKDINNKEKLIYGRVLLIK